MSQRKSTGFFSNWSTMEYSLLAVVILLLCGAAGLVALLVGGLMVEDELTRETTVAPPSAHLCI